MKIKTILYNQSAKNLSGYPIKIKISTCNTRPRIRYLNTGFRCSKANFTKSGRVSSNLKNHEKINERLDQLEIDGKLFYLDNPNATSQDILNHLKKQNKTVRLKEYAMDLIDRRNYNESTKAKKIGVINKVCEWGGNPALFEINETFLKDMIAAFGKQGNAISTIRKNLSILRSICDEARKQGIIEKDHFEFVLKELPNHQTSHKDYLTLEEIEKLKKVDCIDDFDRQALDCFLLQVYARGMRISDAITLKRSDVKNGKISWTAIKTEKHNKQFTISINKELKRIIDAYSGDYILPLMNGLNEDNPKHRERITSHINIRLKRMAKRAKIDKHITTHVARSTFAFMCINKGLKLHEIQSLLGHANISTTEKYLKSIIIEDHKELLDRIYG